MSNPFYGLTPVSVPFSGITDANGNFTYRATLRAAFWTHTRMVATVAGNAVWTVSNGAGPLGFARGPRGQVPSILLAPNDPVIVQVVGAQANAAVTGQFTGAQAPTAEEALTYNPAVGTVAIDVSAPQQVIGSLQAANGAGSIQGFLIPPGMQSIGVMAFGPAASAPVNVSLIGLQTNNIYFQAGTVLPSNGPIWIPLDPTDTQIQAAMTAAAAASSQLDVIVSPLVQAVGIVQPVNVQGIQILTFPGGTGPNENQLSVVVDPVGRNLLRTDATRTADLTNTSGQVSNAVASITFPAQGVGKRLQLAYCWADMSTAAGAAFDVIEVWMNGFGTGTMVFQSGLSVTTNGVFDRIDISDTRLVSGDNQSLGIRLTATTVNHRINAGVYKLQR